MPTIVQSGRPYTSLEIAKEILPRISKIDEITLQTLFFSEFCLDNSDPKALGCVSLIFFSLYNVTTMVLLFIKITNLIMTPWKLLDSTRKS